MLKQNLFFTVILSLVVTTLYGQSPPAISYPSKSTLTLNEQIRPLRPKITGGAASGFTCTPAPPSGITFDPATGIFNGTATVACRSTEFKVSAIVAEKAYYTTLSIAVNNPDVLYNPSVCHLEVDTAIFIKIAPSSLPANTFFTKLSNLQDGLELNAATGVITGTPTIASYPQTDTIVGTDLVTGIKTNFLVSIDVAPKPQAILPLSTSISFVGEGNIQQSLNDRSKLAANTGIGVVFRQSSNRHFGVLHDIEVDFSVNVASTVDTIKSINDGQNRVTNKQEFGNSVLLPLNSGQAFSFNFKGYFTRKGGPAGNFRRNEAPKPLAGVLSGFNLSLNGSNRNWEYDDSIKTVNPTLVKTSLLSLYVGPFYEFYTPTSSNGYNRNISITLGVGYSARWILGDIQQGNQTDFRKRLLGSSKSSYSGGEIQLALRFYNIKAEVHLPFLSNKQSVPGLTGTHLTTFIGFSGGFPIDLTKRAGG